MTVPEHSIANETANAARIDAATQVGVVALTVADLARSVAFYTEALGFAVLAREGGEAVLGASGMPLILLREQPGARPWVVRATGLYHFAILVPSRADLGRWLRHWLTSGHPMPGQADHLVSEALYLNDPDGNGIEIYRDRPRDEWQWDGGQVRMAVDPLDIPGLLDEGDESDQRDAGGAAWAGMPAGTRLGHMHLQVGDIPTAEAFYHGVLGFDLVAKMPSALFVSAGGYHHHIGMNTWHSRGAGPAPAGTAGLRFFSLEVPSETAREAIRARVEAAGAEWTESGGVLVVRDPWRNALLVRVGAAESASAASALTEAWRAAENARQ